MNPKLEKFIGKHIDEVSDFRCVCSEDDNYYSFNIESDSKFYGLVYYNLQVTINRDKIVETVSVVFNEILDRIFYNEIIKDYGYTNSILGFDKLINESKNEYFGESGFHQNLSKREYSMKEVSFDDKPHMVFWRKSFYEIQMTFYYKENGTQLIFRKTV